VIFRWIRVRGHVVDDVGDLVLASDIQRMIEVDPPALELGKHGNPVVDR
jgi:hypothetical protein